MKEKKNRAVMLFTALFISILMVFASSVLHESEIIFPEIAALVTGIFIAPVIPWQVSKIRFVVIMTLSAAFGVIISSLSILLYFKVIIAFIIPVIIISIFKSTLLPAISAAVLPVLMGTTSVIYPITVAVLSVIIVVLWAVSEHYNIMEKKPYVKTSIRKKDILVIFISFALYAVFPTFSGKILFIAPPLVVAFSELYTKGGKFQGKEIKTALVTAVSSAVGAYSCFFIVSKCGIDECVSAVLTLLIVFSLMLFTKCFFPPAAALSLLPLIIDEKRLIYYPLFIATTMFIIAVFIIIKNKTNKQNNILEK